MKKIFQSGKVRRAVAVGSCLYLLAVGALAVLHFYHANVKTISLLDWSIDDLASSIEETTNVWLQKIANAIAVRIGSPKEIPQKEMGRLSQEYDLDEINLVDREGYIVASSDSDVLNGNRSMTYTEKTREFMPLTTNASLRVKQAFRPNANNSSVVRKYVGVPFPKGGFIQVGYNQQCLKNLWVDSYDTFSEWPVGDYGYYIGYDKGNDIVKIQTSVHKELEGKHLADVMDVGAKLDEYGSRHFVAKINGVIADCRRIEIGPIVFIAVVPHSEFKTPAMISVSAFAFVLLLFFLVFLFVLWRFEDDRIKIERMRAAEDKRNAEDLATASSIQHSALPMIFPPFPRDLMIDIYAVMNPAKDVGGDFYDFYYVGLDRIAVIVADVSGKGVPAAMFMMKAKTILKGCILSKNDLADAVVETNNRLCEGNDVDMFVTCWVGVLNERTGELTYVNAGHNPPYIRHADGSIASIPAVSGLFLGAMEGIEYKSQHMQMSRGDTLFVYTDGVTEANDPSGAMYGEMRLEKTLCAIRDSATPRDYCREVLSSISSFIGSASQFDDITMLALRYRGLIEERTICRPAVIGFVAECSAFTEKTLDELGCPASVKADILVAVDEVTNNVASYSGSTEMALKIEIAHDPEVVRISVMDSGKPWNPLDHIDPDISLSADEREIGGLGLMIVKKLMDDVSYAYRDGRNVFAFRKALGK